MRKYLVLIVLSMSLFLVACSNDTGQSNEAADGEYDSSSEKAEISYDSNTEESDSGRDHAEGESQESEETSNDGTDNTVERKIIYTAKLDIVVKNYQQALEQIQNEVADRDGYIVESNMNQDEGDNTTNGSITVRIPQDRFREFIQLVEDGSSKVLESSISGQDVTEEYVDLESRLKSKQVVEARLISFMEQAEITEDLLKISDDLAKVQEEIEEITGRMKYLENRADLATVTINIQENNVTLSTMNEDDLDTWEQTKQQFLKSLNMLLSFFSSLVVFLIGNLPVLLLLAIIGLITYLLIRKRKQNNQKE